MTSTGDADDTPLLVRRPDYLGYRSIRVAGEMAYKKATIGPGDVKVTEIHDAFTIAEILAYEDLGFVKKGGGPRLIADGRTYIGGKVAVNVDGGLKARDIR